MQNVSTGKMALFASLALLTLNAELILIETLQAKEPSSFTE